MSCAHGRRPFAAALRPFAHTLLALCWLACAGVASAADGGEASYRVQAGDLLYIAVWREPELTGEVLVGSDGRLSLPLAGTLVAAGRTIEQIQAAVTAALTKLVPDATVTVALKQPLGNRIYVVGKVNRPGEFAFVRRLDIMQALALAGGTTAFAQVNDIRVLRRGPDGEQRALVFRYGDVERGRDLAQNILLDAGDVVVVP